MFAVARNPGWVARAWLLPQTSSRGLRADPRVAIELVKPVENLGYRGEVKKVRAGYARNYLLPRKLAVYASKESQQRAIDMMESVNLSRARDQLTKRLPKTLTFLKYFAPTPPTPETPAKGDSAPDQAKHSTLLRNPITTKDIISTVFRTHRILLFPEHVILPSPITTMGSHPVSLKVGDTESAINMEVLVKPKIEKKTKAKAPVPDAKPREQAQQKPEAAPKKEQKQVQTLADKPEPTQADAQKIANEEAAKAAIDKARLEKLQAKRAKRKEEKISSKTPKKQRLEAAAGGSAKQESEVKKVKKVAQPKVAEAQTTPASEEPKAATAKKASTKLKKKKKHASLALDPLINEVIDEDENVSVEATAGGKGQEDPATKNETSSGERKKKRKANK